jgi:hypothetical protein
MALSLAAACFLPHKRPGPAQAPQTVPTTEFVLRVTNHNYLDVVVYVLHHGQRTRVGTVTGSSAELFVLPARLLVLGGDIQLFGDAIGNDSYALTERLIVEPGQYVDWTLETDLRRSTVAVY